MEVPNLPGFRSNRHAAAPKAQSLNVSTDVHGRTASYTAGARSRPYQPPRQATTKGAAYSPSRRDAPYHAAFRQRELRETGRLDLPFAHQRTLPQFLRHDKTGNHGYVLKAYAYFKEAVPESSAEDYRVRRVHFIYYLTDDTLEVYEAEQENAGMPQGIMLKRMQLPKPEGGFYTFDDFRIGAELEVYGKRLRITDFDLRTRKYLEEQGRPAGPAEEVEDDAYTRRRLDSKIHETGYGDVPRGRVRTGMTTFQEASLGNQVNATRGRGEFLAHARRVLSFKAVWDTRGLTHGALLRYNVHYFLADGTVEVCEEYGRNDGRDRFPFLLSRRRVPKRYEELLFDDRERSAEGMDDVAADYLTEKDLEVGKHVNIFGRDLLLVDCDGATREYLRETRGYDVRALKVEEEEAPAPERPIPPNVLGIGSEEDSMASVINLRPKKPKKDVVKMLHNDKKTLRFSAKLDSDNPDDKDRAFILSFFLSDDTVSVYEQTTQNSGFWAGTFLERGRHKNKEGEHLRPDHFAVSSVVNIAGHGFRVDGMDNYTHRYLIRRPNRFPFFDVRRLVRNVRQKLQQRHGEDRLHTTFRELDRDRSGHLHMDEIRGLLLELSPDVTPHEVEVVMRYFDRSGDGLVSYHEFLTALQETDEEGDKRMEIVSGRGLTADEFEDVANKVAAKPAPQTIMRRFYDAFADQKHHVVTVFRQFDENHLGLLTPFEFGRAMRQFAHVTDFVVSDIDITVLTEYFFPEGVTFLNYQQFMDVLWRLGGNRGPAPESPETSPRLGYSFKGSPREDAGEAKAGEGKTGDA